MLKYQFLAFFSFCILNTYGQEKILEFNTDYPDLPAIMQNSFTLVNSQSDDFTVFLSTRSNICAYNFSAEMENQGRLLSKQLPNKFTSPLGGTINDKKYTLFYTNSSKSKFAGIIFDFEKRWSNVFEIDLKLKREIFVTQFTHENKFHIITVSYQTNHLNLYAFDNSGNFEKEIIDLTDHEFFTTVSYPARLKTALAMDINPRPITEIMWIQDDVPYSLDSMTSLYKLYILENTLHLAFDINSDFTQIISYNLNSKKAEVKKVAQPEFEKDALTNSYIYDNKLFQIKINPRKMVLRITDFESGAILKEHEITKTDQLYLADGPIRQRGGRYKKYRELEKTSQFLRKVGTGNPSIYVDKFGDQYGLTMGSVEEIDNSAIQALAFVNPFTAFAAIGSVTLFINPVALAFYRASDTKAVYINGFLKNDFEITNGVEAENIFYTINDYLKNENMKRFTAADVFKYKGDYIFGMLNKKNKQYSFQKFEMASPGE